MPNYLPRAKQPPRLKSGQLSRAHGPKKSRHWAMGVRERRSRRERGGKEKKVLTERRESLFVSHSTTNANQDMPLIKKKDFSIPLIPLLQ